MKSESVSESYVTTDGQSASLSWNKAPIWGLRPNFYYWQKVAGLLMWVAFFHERTGLSFTITAGLRQRSHSRVRVPWDSKSYFTVSDLRLPISSPPTTRRATLEVFDPTSTRGIMKSSCHFLFNHLGMPTLQNSTQFSNAYSPFPQSEILYDWRFTANQFVLAPSPLRLTAKILFFNRTPVVILLI
jgi:hypothetical protein